MNRRIDSIIQLIDDESIYPLLKKQLLEIPNLSISYLYQRLAIEKENRPSSERHINKLIQDIKFDLFLITIQKNIHESNFKLSNMILDLNELIFGIENSTQFAPFFNKLCQSIQQKINWKTGSIEIYELLNREVANQFVIDFEEPLYGYNFNSSIQTKKINLYSLALLYLMISDTLDLPIFGLPIQDKLLLCLTKEHCNHNELVYEDDILFYFTPSDKGLVYTLNDLEMIAGLNGVLLDLNNKLPKGNSFIIQHWLMYINKLHNTTHTTQKLSNHFQQIIEMLKNT